VARSRPQRRTCAVVAGGSATACSYRMRCTVLPSLDCLRRKPLR